MGLLGICFAGENAFNFIGRPAPQWYLQHIANNRMGAGMAVWFVGNMATSALSQTGAFEIYADGHLVSVLVMMLV